MAEKPFNQTSLGIIDVIPSPASSKNESEPISLLAVNNIPQQKTKKDHGWNILKNSRETSACKS